MMKSAFSVSAAALWLGVVALLAAPDLQAQEADQDPNIVPLTFVESTAAEHKASQQMIGPPVREATYSAGEVRSQVIAAQILTAQAKPDQAVLQLTQLAYQAPFNADLWVARGNAFWGAGNKRRAWQDFKDALVLDPANRDALLSLGLLYLDLKRPQLAQQSLKALTPLCPFGCAHQDQLARALSEATKEKTPADASAPSDQSDPQ